MGAAGGTRLYRRKVVVPLDVAALTAQLLHQVVELGGERHDARGEEAAEAELLALLLAVWQTRKRIELAASARFRLWNAPHGLTDQIARVAGRGNGGILALTREVPML